MNEHEKDVEDIEAEGTFIMKHYSQDKLMNLQFRLIKKHHFDATMFTSLSK